MQSLYWTLRNHNIGYKGIMGYKLRARLERWDRIQRFMDVVHGQQREQEEVVLEIGKEIASWFIPMTWLTKLKYVKYAGRIFKWKRGVATTEKVVQETVEEVVEEGVKRGGRLGNSATQKQISEIATELESRGYNIEYGGGRYREEYLKPLNGGRKGGSFLDITASHPYYGTLRINTVDVYKNGLATTRELNNAARIRLQMPKGEHLLLIPKR